MEEKFNGKLSYLPEDVAHSTPMLLSFSVVCILHHNNEGEEANKSACIWVLTRIHRLVYTLFFIYVIVVWHSKIVAFSHTTGKPRTSLSRPRSPDSRTHTHKLGTKDCFN